ncbi:MAG: hypothetical protein WA610_12135 [Thermodesulfovibrionales bacterium]
MTGEIENLINELPHASGLRVDEIVSILEGVLHDIECRFPVEDDSDSAYECQNIPKAKELITLVRAWKVSDGELNTGDRKGKDREHMKINKLSKELKITFSQI